MAGGSQESHLTIKQTETTRLPFYSYFHSHLFTHTSTHNPQFTALTGLAQFTGGIGAVVRWFLRLLSGLLAKCLHLPLPVSSGERTTLPEKFSLSEVCARSLDTREWQKKSQRHWMGSTVATLPILCTFCLYRGFGFPFLASNWVTSCHLPLGFPFLATNCVFHCHASTGCLLGLLYVLAFCGISLLYRAFYHFVVLCCCVLRSTNLIDKNGTFKRPFSASNFDNSCHLLRHPLCLFNLQVLSLFHMAFYHHLTLRGCDLNLANLIAKNGSWNLPFLASNSDIRCYTWLYSCFASGLSPLDRDFYHICNHLSVDCGGSIPPLEFWSWISSTLTLDGFHCPLRLTNWVSLRNLSLFTCHVVDLPSELLYLFTRNFSAISCMALSWLVFLTCIFPIDTCLCATCVLEFDGSTSESPLPLHHVTLAFIRPSLVSLFISLLLSTCIMSIDTCSSSWA